MNRATILGLALIGCAHLTHPSLDPSWRDAEVGKVFEGCQVTAPREGEARLACADTSICAVGYNVDSEPRAFRRLFRRVQQDEADVRIEVQGRSLSRRMGTGDRLLAGVRDAGEGSVRTVQCVVPDGKPMPVARYHQLLARGVSAMGDGPFGPSPGDVFGQAIQVPKGCVSLVDGATRAVSCGNDTLAAMTVSAVYEPREVRDWADARTEWENGGSKRVVEREGSCEMAGRSAPCRVEVWQDPIPGAAPNHLIGVSATATQTEILRCSWVGEPATLPAVCAQVLTLPK